MSITQLNTVRRILIALAGLLFTATMITAVRPLQAAHRGPANKGLDSVVTRTPTVVTRTPIRAVHVEGNELVGADGRPVRLLGVNRSGAQYPCVQGWGVFDGPTDMASVAAMVSWHINSVRIPLNEDCWLGINGVSALYGGQSYRSAISSYVTNLRRFGLAVILDLHWSDPGSELATGQQDMADSNHSLSFWSSVAHSFRADPAVIFDLYNEPNGISWRCWRNGCTTPDGWHAAGMQQLVDAVRAAGATQPVIASGLNSGADLTRWLAYRPDDPDHQLIAGFHVYNFTSCASERCWNNLVAPVTERIPVVADELGENDCSGGFSQQFMDWADKHSVSYLAWSWNVASCVGDPSLISSYAGEPTAFGLVIQAHLRVLFARDSRD